MAVTVEIDGVGEIELDDAFLKLSPAKQDETIKGIVAQLKGGGAQPKGDPSRWSSDREAVATWTSGISPRVEAIGRMAGRGIGSLVNSDVKPVGYSDALAEIDADRAAYRDANPKTALASNIAGGVASAATLAPVGGALGALGKAAGTGRIGTAATNLANATSMPGRIAGGAAEGALFGAAQGFGESRANTLDERLADAGSSATTGAMFGAAAPVAAAGAAKVGGAIADIARGSLSGSAYGARKVAEAIRDAGMTADDVVNALRKGPEGMTVADVVKEPGRNLLRSAVNVRGPAQNIAKEALDDRQAGQAVRFVQNINKRLARGDHYYGSLDEFTDMMRTKAEPLYKAAYRKPVDYTDFELDDIAERVPKEAWSFAQRIMNADGYKPGQKLFTVADDGSVSVKPVPDLKQWDYVKRGLDQLINGQDGKGTFGGTTTYGRSLIKLKEELTKKLTKDNTAYRQALNKASDAITLKQAAQRGRDFMKEDIELVRRAVDKWAKDGKEAQLEAARVGFARELIERANKGTDTTDITRYVWNKKTRDIIEALYDKKAATKFAKFVEAEKAMVETRRAAQGNSTTARQLADLNQDQSGVLEVGADVMRAGPITATLNAISRYLRKLGGMGPKNAETVTNMLLMDKKGVQALPRMIGADAQASRAFNATGQRLLDNRAIGGLLGAGAVSPATTGPRK